MAKTKWWVVTLVTLLVMVVLAAGGYALYRVGYAHGAQVNLVEKRLPQKFLDQLDRLDREGKPADILPRLRMREFGRRFMFLDPGLRRPMLFPWRMVIPIAVVVILVALVVVLAVALLTRRTSAPSVAPPPAAPPSPEEPAAKA